jgi:hypothetical protein
MLISELEIGALAYTRRRATGGRVSSRDQSAGFALTVGPGPQIVPQDARALSVAVLGVLRGSDPDQTFPDGALTAVLR